MVNCFLVKLRQVIAYVYIALIVLVGVCVDAFPFAEDSHECGKCNDEYKTVTSTFTGKLRDNARYWCAACFQFQRCIKPLEFTCRPDLNFQGGRSLIAAHIKRYACDRLHLTWNETLNIITRPVNLPMNPPKCQRPRYKPTYKICGLFGDPHLWTFDNKRHTCSVPGAWPLIANRHLTVQVTNIPLDDGSRATATSTVTVIVKGLKRKCIKAKTYQAKSFSLPAVFSDETKSSDDGPCSTTIRRLGEGRVMIDICPLKTKIYIRQVEKYLTVHMRVPSDLMMRKTIGLCQHGCPRIEQMNMDKMPRVNNLLASYAKDTMSKRVKRQRRKRARKLCRAAKVAGFYYKSCLFDVMTSNDASFVRAAETAMQDFQEINVDDNGEPIVDENTRAFKTGPTKRPRGLATIRTKIEFDVPTSSSSAPRRTNALATLSALLIPLMTINRLLY